MSPFIDAAVQVRAAGVPEEPVEFVWQGRRYPVVQTLHRWFDWGFSAGTARRSWRSRRHRTYFRVRTEDGSVWELYLDRASAQGEPAWVLYRRIDPDEAEG